MEKGRAALRQAEILCQSNEFDGSVSRAYYAIFHFASALLFSKGLEARSHEGVRRLFSLHFIREGIFEKKYGTILSHAQKAREESDYEPEVPFTQEDALLRLQEAREFLKRVEKHLHC
ncbi:MAG: HEPN domain-containing protein [Deltaproteobacteria bacterium]|nr:HEPN domain-containing protein [Deltaproteobacteria bacterium]MBI4224430.1 HEPN domain-containing protein [Deltaproteobacteria bacterium]